jgi:hypothetical protein
VAEKTGTDEARREGEASIPARRTWEPVSLKRLGTFGDALIGGTGMMNKDSGPNVSFT